jgi:small subunit ribosomal protein S19e
MHGPIGISDLKSAYGGRKRIGYNLDHHKDAGGAIIRKALQQLESAGYITKKSKGRLMSDDGMKKIDRLATEIQNDIIKTEPELQRYA